MYINFTILLDRNISFTELLALQTVFQKEYELLKEIRGWGPMLTELEADGLITSQKNGHPKLTKKGNSLLKDIGTPLLTPEIKALTNEVTALYEAAQKPVGKFLEVQDRVAWFVTTTGFANNVIVAAVEDHLNESGEYTMSLPNLLWKPESVAFSVHKTLKSSKLYDIICKKYNLKFDYESKSRSKQDLYEEAVARLNPPLKGSGDMFMTGSSAGDYAIINRFKKSYLKKVRNTLEKC